MRSNFQVGSHIRVGLGEPDIKLTLSEAKRLCAAMIYFEPVITVLNTLEGCEPMFGNYGDNDDFRGRYTSPAQAIAFIHGLPDADGELSWDRLFDAFGADEYESKDIWDIWDTKEGDAARYCLRRGCIKAEEMITWTEFAIAFVKAALACPDIPTLFRYPVTYRGFNSFMYARPMDPSLALESTGPSTSSRR